MSESLEFQPTGIDLFDNDIREFIRICGSPEELEQIIGKCKDEKLSRDQFLKSLPVAILKLCLSILSGEFQELSGSVSDEIKTYLEKVSQLFKEKFSVLIGHAVIKEMVALRKRSRKERMLGDRVESIEASTMWMNTPPKLTPVTRIQFRDKDDKVLMETNANVNDMGYMLSSLSTLLSGLLERGVTLAEANFVDNFTFDALEQHLKCVRNDIEKIEELAEKYGVQFDATSDEVETSQ